MINILLVDDDKDFHRLVSRILEHAGYSVFSCYDAHDAIEQLQRETFDLVLSDANMPGGSGFDLVRTIRRGLNNQRVAIALLTARRDKKDVVYGLGCGADDYIIKPIDHDLFLAKIASLLKKKPPQARLEIHFPEFSMHLPARWDVPSEITHLSEQGLTISSPIFAPPNSRFKLAAQLFIDIGIDPPLLRVVTCAQAPENPHLFQTKTSFVGITDSELQKVRFWINTHLARKGEAVAV